MYTFNFNGIDSSQYSIMMSETPNRPSAANRVIKYEVPGRDGVLTYVDGSCSPIPIPVKCTIMDISEQNLREVKVWLQGYGPLVFSDEPEVYWKARLDNQIDFTIPMRLVHQFIIQFDCFPYAYGVNNPLINLYPSEQTKQLFNPGTLYSRPTVKIYGNGDMDLIINSDIVHLTNITDYVIIDGELVDCYKDETLMNSNMSGDFPILIPGLNDIGWSGNITKVEITPNWRWR